MTLRRARCVKVVMAGAGYAVWPVFVGVRLAGWWPGIALVMGRATGVDIPK